MNTYSYVRGLELEGNSPHDAGMWARTGSRMMYGEGVPPPGHPANGPYFYSETKGFPPTRNAPVADRGWLGPYQTARTTHEAEAYLRDVRYGMVRLSCYLSKQWLREGAGQITMPGEGDLLAEPTHSVVLQSIDSAGNMFTFENWWRDWGHDSRGSMAAGYFSRFGFERVVQSGWPDPPPSEVTRDRPRVGFDWRRATMIDACRRPQHVLEIVDRKDGLRAGWAFATERPAAMCVDDFYVRPAYRRLGFGRYLAGSLGAFAGLRGLPIELYVSWADARRESPGTQAAMTACVRRMGLRFRPAGVEWAAYAAGPSSAGSPTPIEPLFFPARPRGPEEDLKRAAAAVTIGSAIILFGGADAGASADAPSESPSVVAASPIAEPEDESLRVAARRWELNGKKADRVISPEEAAELARLNRRAIELFGGGDQYGNAADESDELLDALGLSREGEEA